jgi:hypothetical protein
MAYSVDEMVARGETPAIAANASREAWAIHLHKSKVEHAIVQGR